jgi:hypothetical protein
MGRQAVTGSVTQVGSGHAVSSELHPAAVHTVSVVV